MKIARINEVNENLIVQIEIPLEAIADANKHSIIQLMHAKYKDSHRTADYLRYLALVADFQDIVDEVWRGN